MLVVGIIASHGMPSICLTKEIEAGNCRTIRLDSDWGPSFTDRAKWEHRMLILVTGATGKVGRRFITRLLADEGWHEARVKALCHNRTLAETARLSVVKGSIADRLTAAKAMADVTHV